MANAFEIKREQNLQNQYHIDKHRAAVILVDHGMGNAKYLTHYSSGSTYWNNNGAAVRVSPEGAVEKAG